MFFLFFFSYFFLFFLFFFCFFRFFFSPSSSYYYSVGTKYLDDFELSFSLLPCFVRGGGVELRVELHSECLYGQLYFLLRLHQGHGHRKYIIPCPICVRSYMTTLPYSSYQVDGLLHYSP